MSISARQVRAALGLLGMKQKDLAESIRVSKTILSKYLNERQSDTLGLRKVEEIRFYLESHSIEFLDYNGVREKPEGVFRVLRGSEGFKEFIYDVYHTVKETGGHICVSNADERAFERWQGGHAEDYLSKMAEVRDLSFQILVCEGDDYYTASAYAQYRQLSVAYFGGVPTYIYGEKKAEILFGEDDVTVYLFENAQLAEAQRKKFQALWELAVA